MPYTAQTENYGLPIYEDKPGNKPTYLGDWNEAMNTIDSTMKSISESGGGGGGTDPRVDEALETARTAQSTAQAASAAASEAQSTADDARSVAQQARSAASTAQSTADAAQQTATQANAAATNAQATAQQASTAASEAKSAAEAANSAAGEAKSAADSASETASAAQSTAQQASTAASEAKSAASTAQSAADDAKSAADSAGETASAAQSTAQQAKSAADTAQSTADAAKSAAGIAQSVARAAMTAADSASETASAAQSTAQQASTAASEAKSAASTAQSAADDAARGTDFFGKTILFIGDSWAAEGGTNFTSPYTSLVAKSLGATKISLYNPSGGFTRGGTEFDGTFQQYFDDWYTKNQSTAAGVNYVIIMGGLNDYGATESTVKSAIKALVNDISRKMKNATIYLIPQIASPNMVRCSVNTQNSVNTWARTARIMFEAYNELASSVSVRLLDSLVYCMQFGDFDTLMQDDMIHPTQAGSNYIARQIVRALLGLPVKSFVLTNPAPLLNNAKSSGTCNSTIYFEGTNLVFSASCNVTIPNISGSNHSGFAIRTPSFVPVSQDVGITYGTGFFWNTTKKIGIPVFTQAYVVDTDMTSASNYAEMRLDCAGGWQTTTNGDVALAVANFVVDFAPDVK